MGAGVGRARIGGLDCSPSCLPFASVLAIPKFAARLLRRSFVTSASVLLALSWYVYFAPIRVAYQRRRRPFQGSITQGTVLTLCFFGLLEYAAVPETHGRAPPAEPCWRRRFLNIVFAIVSRTALVAVPILLICSGPGICWRQMIVFLGALVALGAVLWASSSYLRERITKIPQEIATYDAARHDTSAGARIEFWKDSIEIMREAPFIGHGIGAITDAFARLAGAASNATNAHNQSLTVGIQLGFLGIAVLIAMWVAHAWLFRVPGSELDRTCGRSKTSLRRCSTRNCSTSRPDGSMCSASCGGWDGHEGLHPSSALRLLFNVAGTEGHLIRFLRRRAYRWSGRCCVRAR